MAAEQLASLEVTNSQADAKNSDTSADGAARQSEDEGERGFLDPELWKPHLPTEDCPVCFVPLPLASGSTTYWPCCGKTICTGCSIETMRAENVITPRGPGQEEAASPRPRLFLLPRDEGRD